jgi:hypothetical protein
MFSATASARPTLLGNPNSINTAFNGDLTKVQFAIAQTITGAATLDQPSSGYEYTPETSAIYGYLYNSSGWNQSTGSNIGRTGATFSRVKVDNYGQGDATAYNASGFVTGGRAGATNWLANPAVTLFNGDATAGADGVYLNPGEFNLDLGNYDAAAIGWVANITRNKKSTPAGLGAYTAGFRVQSNGMDYVDEMLGGVGKFMVGLNVAAPGIEFFNQYAIGIKANDRISLNATLTDVTGGSFLGGGDYLSYSGANSQTEFYGLGAPQFSVGRVAGAINYVQARGAVSNSLPGFYAQGPASDISVGYRAKGAGYHIFYSGGGTDVQFSVAGNSASVMWLQASGAPSGGIPLITAQGSDAAIDAALKGKGTYGVRLIDGGNATRVQVNTTGVGFNGIAPIAKPTLPAPLPLDGTASNVAIATLLNAVRAALISYGLAQ